MKKKPIEVSHLLAEPKEIRVEIPEGYEIDKEKSTFERIVFKKKGVPKSWKEYCDTYSGERYWYENELCAVDNCGIKLAADSTWPKRTLPTKELAEKFLAYRQLMSLRYAWIGNWEPDWNKFAQDKWCIMNNAGKPVTCICGYISRPLSFPTREMAVEFIHCFEDLLEQAKELY